MARSTDPDHKNRTLLLTGAILGGGSATALAAFFTYSHYWPNTPDAYVHAYTITVAPYVAGYINQIKVEPNQYVKSGQLIYEIEPEPLQLLVDTKANQLKASQSHLASMQQQLRKAQQELNNHEAARWLVALNRKRYAFLLDKQVVALEKEQELEASTIEADAQVRRAQAEIARIEERINEQKARIKAHASELGTAKTNLHYTRYYAPMDGFISNSFSIREGHTSNQARRSSSWWTTPTGGWMPTSRNPRSDASSPAWRPASDWTCIPDRRSRGR